MTNSLRGKFHKLYLFTISRLNKKLARLIPARYLLPVRQLLFRMFRRRCKDNEVPVSYYTDGSWINMHTTPDQQMIETYLSGIDLKGKSLLHIGIGNSSLAKCFAKEASLITGITLVPAEKELADSLAILNYPIYLGNKYGKLPIPHTDKFDFIIDNNLSSYACCYYHFEKMLNNYLCLLKPDGVIVTCKRGLEYYTSGIGMTFEDLVKLKDYFPLKVARASEEIYLIEKA